MGCFLNWYKVRRMAEQSLTCWECRYEVEWVQDMDEDNRGPDVSFLRIKYNRRHQAICEFCGRVLFSQLPCIRLGVRNATASRYGLCGILCVFCDLDNEYDEGDIEERLYLKFAE